MINGTVGDAKTRQMTGFTLDDNKNTPLTTYFGTKIAVSWSTSIVPSAAGMEVFATVTK